VESKGAALYAHKVKGHDLRLVQGEHGGWEYLKRRKPLPGSKVLTDTRKCEELEFMVQFHVLPRRVSV
jgi:hypothetical protein